LAELVAERGYEGLKIRDLVKSAGISSRAFYERFGGKEDCFGSTYELLAGRAVRRIGSAQTGEREWRRRPRLMIEELTREAARDPLAAHLILVTAYEAGPKSLERAWRVERLLSGMVAESLARPRGVTVPPRVAEGMVAGVVKVMQGRLRDAKTIEPEELDEVLTNWLLSYANEEVRALDELDGGSIWRDTRLGPQAAMPVAMGTRSIWPPTGDRGLALSAVARLAVADGYDGLTPARIRSAAGIGRQSFEDHFAGVEECYAAAVRERVEEALAQAVRAQTAAATRPGGVYRAIAAICDQVAGDPFLAKICLADDFSPGSPASRTRAPLAAAAVEQFSDAMPRESRPTGLVTEATIAAVWGVFHHHMVRDWVKRRRVAATLAYLALCPVIGPRAAVAAIRVEQSG
jgi:AcrR family transcriptional regulator